MLPSRLKEYPKGNMKETILSFTPKRSNSSVNLGKTASLLVVPKAIIKGLMMCCKRVFNLRPRKTKPNNNKKSHNEVIPTRKELKYFM